MRLLAVCLSFAVLEASAAPKSRPRGARPSLSPSPSPHPVPAPPVIRFPEESRSDLWGASCASDFVTLQPQESVRIRVTKRDGRFWAAAAMRLNPEPGETPADLARAVEALIRDVPSYPKWVLPGINDRPDGGSYFVTVDGLESALRQEKHYTLTGPYTFRVLWFERTGRSTLEARLDEGIALPDCLRRPGDPSPLAHTARPFFRMTPRPEIVEWLLAELYTVPRAYSTELHLRLVLKPSRIVYELLGEGLVRSQVETRGRRIFENFLDFRRNAAARGAASGVAGAPAKAAGP